VTPQTSVAICERRQVRSPPLRQALTADAERRPCSMTYTEQDALTCWPSAATTRSCRCSRNSYRTDCGKSVAGTSTIDPHTATVGDICASADAVVDQYERNVGQQWVAEVFEKEAAGGNAVVGLEGSVWAGSVAAIQRLLIQEDATARWGDL
jgi:hypothetical protein